MGVLHTVKLRRRSGYVAAKAQPRIPDVDSPRRWIFEILRASTVWMSSERRVGRLYS